MVLNVLSAKVLDLFKGTAGGLGHMLILHLSNKRIEGVSCLLNKRWMIHFSCWFLHTANNSNILGKLNRRDVGANCELSQTNPHFNLLR